MRGFFIHPKVISLTDEFIIYVFMIFLPIKNGAQKIAWNR